MAFKSEEEKNKVIDNLDYKTKKEEIQKVAKYEPGNNRNKTLKDLLGKDFNYTGPIKILPGETLEEAVKRLLEEQKKQGN